MTLSLQARWFVTVVLLMGAALAARADVGSRTIVGGGNEYLSKGADAIRSGDYEEGIRLTHLGLKVYQPSAKDRAAALSNLCAAYVAHGDPEEALNYCNESLALNGRNWRTYSNRAAAYTVMGLYSEAIFDIDAASAINPNSRNVKKLRGILNELRLSPRVTMEDHP